MLPLDYRAPLLLVASYDMQGRRLQQNNSNPEPAFIATSGQIILFLFKSHHFRTYFLYMIRCNNISRSPQPAAQNLGVATPNPTPELTPLLHSTSLSYSYLDLQPVYQLSFNSYCTSGFTIICLLSTPPVPLAHHSASLSSTVPPATCCQPHA